MTHLQPADMAGHVLADALWIRCGLEGYDSPCWGWLEFAYMRIAGAAAGFAEAVCADAGYALAYAGVNACCIRTPDWRRNEIVQMRWLAWPCGRAGHMENQWIPLAFWILHLPAALGARLEFALGLD